MGFCRILKDPHRWDRRWESPEWLRQWIRRKPGWNEVECYYYTSHQPGGASWGQGFQGSRRKHNVASGSHPGTGC